MRKYECFTVVIITAFLVLMFFSLSCGKKDEEIFLHSQEEFSESNSKAEENMKEITEASEETLYVYICGAVLNPGIYEMKPGNRIADVLDKAGGFTKEACKTYVNLAKRVADEEKIFIPKMDEISDLSDEIHYNENQGNKKINLNTADVKELKSLSGIGDSKANAIIEYRETHGKYNKIEDIMKISGIKEAMFQKIKDRISVN